MNEHELDRLEELLAAPVFKDEAMPLDTLQGFLCAVASGPEEIAAESWLPEVLGTQPTPDMQEAVDLLLKFYASTAAALDSGEEFDLILYGQENDPDALDYASWCDGYIYGTQVGDINWFDAAGEFSEDLNDKMEAFFLLNGLMKEDALKHKEPWLSPKEEKKAMEDAEEALPLIVGALYRFWQTQRAKPAPLRREEPKTGRNDPCPCGSGKKFKQCCGKEHTLH